ncbi:50S ribosomal protein L7ae [Candidatus Woesearchaeota archaeon]|nr:50S ribosomal protein L7ae [Candidatus Woesearchaeota archaeon]
MKGEKMEEKIEKVYEAIEIARTTGKIKKGANEVTKAIERGSAKLVVTAKDTTPPEIIMHIPLLCEEKNITFAEVPRKDELGASAGLSVSTSAVAITKQGEAKSLIKELSEE